MQDSSVKKYILGINKFTKSILKHVQVDGIIDDFTRVQRSRKKEILSIQDVDKDALILSVSTGSPLEVKAKLDQMGFTHFNYLSFYRYSGLGLLSPPFMEDFKADFLAHRSHYQKLYERLDDQESKEVFTKLINFKITYDLNYMQGFSNNHEGQYFDLPMMPELKNLRFVDGGGYVGDTAEQLLKHYPDTQKIYLIEPIKTHLDIAKRELGHLSEIVFIQAGLSDKKATVSFHEEKSFSAPVHNGAHTIELDTIDNLIKEDVDFIKLDIEGAEVDALHGARETILASHPILAVCIYHKASHWYEVPEAVLAIRSDYKLYLRHYMEGIFETVLYFIPEKH